MPTRPDKIGWRRLGTSGIGNGCKSKLPLRYSGSLFASLLISWEKIKGMRNTEARMEKRGRVLWLT